MPLLTPAQLRDDFGIETDLSDTALTEIIAAQEYEIQIVAGASDQVVEYHYLTDGSTDLVLRAPAASIVSVTAAEELIPADGYTLVTPRVLRSGSGVWRAPVVVVYEPANVAGRQAQHRAVLAQLVKLYLAYNGYSSVGTPDIRTQGLDYEKERARILSRLDTEWLLA